MALATHFLGPYFFDGFFGTPDFTEEQIAGEARAQVNGHSLWMLGVRGQEFELGTVRGCLTYALAGLEIVRYKQASQRGPLNLMIHNLIVPGGRYQVLGVRAEAKAMVQYHRAGDSLHYLATVRATWRLLPIAHI